MKWGLYIVLLFSSAACVHDYELKPVDPYSIFHCNSSKVWLVNHLYRNKKDYSPMSIGYKDMVIFHETKVCYFHKIKEFDSFRGRKADFEVDGKRKEVIFQFKNEQWIFKLISYSLHKIILKPVKAKNFNYTIELIPFPEY